MRVECHLTMYNPEAVAEGPVTTGRTVIVTKHRKLNDVVVFTFPNGDQFAVRSQDLNHAMCAVAYDE